MQDGLIVDLFAGGGGTSIGIKEAFGRSPDIAVNHDPDAVRMHQTNHPETVHYLENVWDVNPHKVCKGRHVSLLWLSPDCKHFSKAKGGKPKDKHIRGLAWTAVWWACAEHPDVIILENVEEFQTWGPLNDDGTPDINQRGRTFQSFIRALRAQGYEIDWRELRACDYGAPTSRKRFYLIARCDGRPIVWPKPTHGDPESIEVRFGMLKPWRTAAEIIDWSIPCPSIFDRKKPLVENTMKRIARGLQKFVLEDPEPFIVPTDSNGILSAPTMMSAEFNNAGGSMKEPVKTLLTGNHQYVVSPYIARIGQTKFGGDRLSYQVDKPLTTVASKAEHLLVAPILTQYHSYEGDGARGQSLEQPMLTIDASNRYALTCTFLSKYFAGGYTGPGADMNSPLPTVTGVDHNALVTSHLVKLYGTSFGSGMRAPVPTVTANGQHIGEVRAFLIKYYGHGTGQPLNRPLDVVTSHDTFGLVMVHGEPYQIVDIGMRMLTPRELFDAQGCPHDYIIDHDYTGKIYPKSVQVARCGNMVCPPVAAALVSANLPELKMVA